MKKYFRKRYWIGRIKRYRSKKWRLRQKLKVTNFVINLHRKLFYPPFISFSKIPRLSRDCIITEKIDGTNAQVCITKRGKILAGSRNRWLTVDKDNYGFAAWVKENHNELLTLGPGRHFGEWWGRGINRNYGMKERRFSLFNVRKWNARVLPPCCNLVPILYEGLFTPTIVEVILEILEVMGSSACSGFMKPEGIVIFHKASGQLFKKTIENDAKLKGK